MKSKPYNYRLALYTEGGSYLGVGHVLSDVNLDGILRDEMFIKGSDGKSIAGYIEHIHLLN